jgi:hypothetical protein
MTKICRKCNQEKPLSEFYEQADMRDGHRHNCKSCHLAAHQVWYERNRQFEMDRVNAWRKRNPERVSESRRRRKASDPERYRYRDREGHLRRKYGLTQNLFEALVAAQLGNCAICGANEDLELHVDHDHRTKKVRGLLCGKCNKAIGLLNDDPHLLEAAKQYLERAERFYSRAN